MSPTATTAQHSAVMQFRTMDSPVGELLLVGSERGLAHIAFPHRGHTQNMADLHEKYGEIEPGDQILQPAVAQLAQYFAGDRRHFDLPLDLPLPDGFRKRALQFLRTIPYGQTRSYAQVAAGADSPAAVRAAGSACANNPIPIVIPCHRVVKSDGSIGGFLNGYLGGLNTKRTLLDLEQRALGHTD